MLIVPKIAKSMDILTKMEISKTKIVPIAKRSALNAKLATILTKTTNAKIYLLIALKQTNMENAPSVILGIMLTKATIAQNILPIVSK